MAQTTVTNLLHIVFSTKNRVEIIREETEDELYKYMSGILRNHKSPCLAINGTANHVHMLVSLSKNIALADLMEDLKKDSSKWIKTKGAWYRDFHWQDGYGGFSIGESGVPALKQYIAKQKEHHKKVRFEDEFIALLKKIQGRIRRTVLVDVTATPGRDATPAGSEVVDDASPWVATRRDAAHKTRSRGSLGEEHLGPIEAQCAR